MFKNKIYFSCGANICLFYFKTKFHVLIIVNKKIHPILTN